MFFNQNTSIRESTELALEFGRLVAEHPWSVELEFNSVASPKRAELRFDGHVHGFVIRYELAPSPQDIARWFPREGERELLVVPNLSPALLAACRTANLSATDLNGRLLVRAPGVLIELPAIEGRRFRYELEPRNIFTGKSARIVRALLADPKRSWRQADIVVRSGATSGLVSRVITHLERQGLLERSGVSKRDKSYRLLSLDTLLNAWAKADTFSRRATTHRFHCLEQDPVRLAHSLRNALTHQGPHFAFTQWIAAWLRQPYTEPPVVSLYAPHLPVPEILDGLGLRPVNEGGRVWLHLPSDEGVFRETRVVQDLPLVSDAQIYLDLLDTGLRGPAQARALRESPVFCQP